MGVEKLVKLIESLNRATREGRVDWASTSSESRFRVALGPAELEIEREEVGYQILPRQSKSYNYVVYVRESGGPRAVELEFFGPKDQEYELVKELYAAARKKALNLDQMIDNMIQNLEHPKSR